MKGKLQLERKQDEFEYIPLDDRDKYLFTFDLGASAALVTAGFDLVSIDKSDTRKVLFVFKRTTGIGEAMKGYWDDTLRVKARSQFDNTKMIKNRIYSE